MELKRIDFTTNKLVTDKHTYTLAESLSVDKYQEFLLIQQEVAYGISFEENFTVDKQIYAALNEKDFVKASALLYNKQAGIVRGIEKRNDPILKLCALFLIREDEDQTRYNKELNAEKVQEWIDGGVDYKDFFQLAAVLIPSFVSAFEEILALTSTLENKAAKAKEVLTQLKDTTKPSLESPANGSE